LISLDYPSGALVVSEITKLSPPEPGNERLNLCGVSRIMIRIFSSTTAPILCGALLGGESERVFFAFFTLVFRKHTAFGDTPRRNALHSTPHHSARRLHPHIAS
jgi:hypothetical protein